MLYKEVIEIDERVRIIRKDEITRDSGLKIIKGTVRILKILTMAVKLTDKATSPLANFVSTLDVTPTGAAAIIIKPNAISVCIGIIRTKTKAIIGNRIT